MTMLFVGKINISSSINFSFSKSIPQTASCKNNVSTSSFCSHKEKSLARNNDLFNSRKLLRSNFCTAHQYLNDDTQPKRAHRITRTRLQKWREKKKNRTFSQPPTAIRSRLATFCTREAKTSCAHVSLNRRTANIYRIPKGEMAHSVNKESTYIIIIITIIRVRAVDNPAD